MSREEPREDFSLVQGGPLCGLFRRVGLMRPPMGYLGRRIAALVLLAWLPLPFLAAATGHLFAGEPAPFLHQLGVHARLLGSLPILLAAEVLVHHRLSVLIRQFDVQELVPAEARARFDDILASTRRLAGRVAPEVVIALVAFTLGHWIWIRSLPMSVESWYGRRTEDGLSLSAAGAWYAFVSLPLLRFILYRWYFRLALWYRLLWKVARLPLNLNPAHPDRAGGLGFLGQSLVAFAPVLLAHTVSLSGLLADLIWHRGAALIDFKIEIGALFALLLLLVLAPLYFFSPSLSRARRKSLAEHGAFAARYVDQFTRKWLRPSDVPPPSPLGSSDIQSLADLGTHYQSVREMRLAPVSKKAVLLAAVLLALPLLPLVLTMMPLEELIARLAKLDV